MQAAAVEIHAPRLKERTSGTRSAAAVPSAAGRSHRGAPAGGASPAARATTTPQETAEAIPMTSVGPKVPTARTFSPRYEAPVPVRYWWTPTAPCTTATATSEAATARVCRGERSVSTRAAGTRTNTWSRRTKPVRPAAGS